MERSTEIPQKEKASVQRKEIVDQQLAIGDSCTSRSFEQNTERGSSRSCCISGLASPMLVSQSSGDAETGTNLPQSKKGPTPVTKSSKGSTPNLAQTQPPSQSLIRESLAKYDLSSTAKDVLMASWREDASKQYHTLKLTMLLCFTSGQRGQTIHKFDINYIQDLGDRYRISVHEKLKQTKPGRHLEPIELLALSEDKELCVV